MQDHMAPKLVPRSSFEPQVRAKKRSVLLGMGKHAVSSHCRNKDVPQAKGTVMSLDDVFPGEIHFVKTVHGSHFYTLGLHRPVRV